MAKYDNYKGISGIDNLGIGDTGIKNLDTTLEYDKIKKDKFLKKYTGSLSDLLGSDYEDFKAKYFLNNRNDIFHFYGADRSLIDKGAVEVVMLPNQRPNEKLQAYESKIARNTTKEFTIQSEYETRSEELIKIVEDQLQSGTDRPRLSVGVEAMLETAIDFMESLSEEKVREYQSAGCLGYLDGPEHVHEAKKFLDWLRSDNESSNGTFRKDALSLVKTFTKVASYERFGPRYTYKIPEDPFGPKEAILYAPKPIEKFTRLDLKGQELKEKSQPMVLPGKEIIISH